MKTGMKSQCGLLMPTSHSIKSPLGSFRSLVLTICRYNISLNETQLRVFAALYNWRDHVARSQDEVIPSLLSHF